MQQRQVALDGPEHAGPQHLHRHLAPIEQRGEVHLRDGGAGHRHRVEGGEDGIERAAEGALHQRHRHRAGKRRDAVLQPGQLVCHVERQQVSPRRQHLSELDEDRPQPLERASQPHAARLVEAAADHRDAPDRAHPAPAEAGQRDVVQAEAQDGEDDEDQARELAHLGLRPRAPAGGQLAGAAHRGAQPLRERRPHAGDLVRRARTEHALQIGFRVPPQVRDEPVDVGRRMQRRPAARWSAARPRPCRPAASPGWRRPGAARGRPPAGRRCRATPAAPPASRGRQTRAAPAAAKASRRSASGCFCRDAASGARSPPARPPRRG